VVGVDNMIEEIIEFLESNEQFGDDWSEEISYLNLLKRKLHRIEEVARKWFDYGDYDWAEILEILGVEFGKEEEL
tara:strand:+ start:357 stop:581 length:225 start_codon:yes stop_codon:yes gene_type:complete